MDALLRYIVRHRRKNPTDSIAVMKHLSPLHNQRGVSLMIVLVMMVVMGLAAGMAGTAWKDAMQREREAELLWRGDQYRNAIGSYYKVAHAGAQGAYPPRLEDLLKDPRSLQTVRHIRRLYKDPMTGEDFEPVRQGGQISGIPGASQSLGAIRGVRSTSKLGPFKKDGFAEEYEKFKDADEYSDWEFVFEPKAPAAQPTPAGGAATGQPPVQQGQ